MDSTTHRKKRTPEGPSAPESLGGRVLPNSLEAEQAVLACCLLQGVDAVSRCVEAGLRAASFYSPAHAAVYDAICAIIERGQPLDSGFVVLLEELNRRGQLASVGGPGLLAELSSRVQTTLHLPHYIEIVRDKAMARRLIQLCAQTVEGCFSLQGGVQEYIEEVEQGIFALSEMRTDETRHVRQTIEKQAIPQIQAMLNRERQAFGVGSGFDDLDKMTFGFQPGDMVVLAARPSMGKTSFALNVAEHAILPKKSGFDPAHTLVFSLEMNALSLVMRMLCSRARVDQTQLREGTARKQESFQKIMEAGSEFMQSPLRINDSASLSISEIRAIARRIHRQQPLKLVVIDYLQLIKGSGRADNREQEVAEISRGVKGLAKELNVPVIVLSQLNRGTEKENRAPRLSDLRESGSIEQDADLVLMLSRPRDAKEEEFGNPIQKVELIIAKQRNGAVGTVPLIFYKSLTRFENYTES